MKLKNLKLFICTIIFVSLLSYCPILVIVAKAYSTISALEITEKDTGMNLRIKGPLENDDPELLQYLLREVLIPPSMLPYNLSSNLQYVKAKNSFSWFPIHLAIKNLLANITNGFFVEAGALDGEFLSNTLWLEQTLNWTGLLVEPEKVNFRDMVWKRRKAWLSNSCLSNENFAKEVLMVSVRKKLKEQGNILPLTARGTSYQYKYGNVVKNNKSMDFFSRLDYTYYKSQCFSLYSNLLALNRSVIDFISLDLQGSEQDVFKTIPLAKVYVRSFVIEDAKEKTNYELIKYFNNLGFDLFSATAFGPDYFFVNRKDPELLATARSLRMAQRFIDKGITFEFPSMLFGKSFEEIMEIQNLIKKQNTK